MKDVFVYMFPGIVYFWLFFIAQGPMQEILNEQEHRTLQRMLAAPVSVLEFLLSKVIRCFLLCAVIQGLLLVVSAVLFGVRWGSPLLLAPAVLACSLSVTGLLALIYALAQTKIQAYSLSSVIVIVCALVGGSFFPFYEMPAFLQTIGQYSPNRWGIRAIQIVAWSQPPVNVVKPIAILCTVGVVGSTAAVALLHRRLAFGGRR